MAEILSIQHERIDDVPLIIGVANKLRMVEILNAHLGTHGLQQGLNNGQLALGWLAYILSQAYHRKRCVIGPMTSPTTGPACWGNPSVM